MIAFARVVHDDITENQEACHETCTRQRNPATRLLDLRFNYMPAAATDIAATWRRFGFDPREQATPRTA